MQTSQTQSSHKLVRRKDRWMPRGHHAVIFSALSLYILLASSSSQVSAVEVGERPACDLRTPFVPVTGSLQEHHHGFKDKPGWEFALDAGCSYRFFESAHTLDCLKGSWVVVSGASQTNIWTMQFANSLVNDALSTNRDDFVIDGVFTLLIDLIIQDGEVIYRNIVKDHRQGLDERIGAHTAKRDKHVLSEIFQEVWQKPLQYNPNMIRITNFFAEYWDDVPLALEAVKLADSWSKAPATVVIAVGLWYINSYRCDVASESKHWCATRPEYGKLHSDELLYEYRRGAASTIIEHLAGFCAPGGRAEHMGCAVLSIDHCQYMHGDIWHRTRDTLEDVMRNHATRTLRYVDLWTLTLQVPEDCVGGHQSPMSAEWTWQVLLGGACPNFGSAAGDLAVFSGNLCRAAQVDRHCAHYLKHGFHYIWECSVSKPCQISTVSPPATLQRSKVNRDVVIVDFDAASKVTPAQTWFETQRDAWTWGTVLLVCFACVNFIVLCACGGLASYPRKGYTCLVNDCVQSADTARVTKEDGWENVHEVQRDSTSNITKDNTSKLSGASEDKYPNRVQKHPKNKASAEDVHSNVEEALPETNSHADKFAFGLARCLASLHVVLGHLCARQAVGDVYFFNWGFTWVPWFFMLSGFILFSAQRRREKHEPVIQYVRRRSLGIYPLYGVSLIVSYMLAKARGLSPGIVAVMFDAILGQAWIPWITEGSLQMQCWFLSCLVSYWAVFKPLYEVVDSLTKVKQTIVIVVLISIFPWMIIIIPACAGDVEWYARHQFGDTHGLADIAVIFLKFHPFCYLHVFVLGMVLAKMRELLKRHAHRPRLVIIINFLGPVGYASLLLIFLVPQLRPAGAKLSARLSVLLPLQGAVLMGLAGLPDQAPTPLATIFKRFNWLESYSYAIYIMQFICMDLWPERQIGLTFFVMLATTAAVSVHLVQKPLEKFCRAYPDWFWIAPVAIATTLVIMSLFPTARPASKIREWVRIDDAIVDVHLPLEGDAPNQTFINPSILFRKEEREIVVAARNHYRTTVKLNSSRNGRQITLVEETWHSTIAIGAAAFDSVSWNSWLRGSVPMALPVLSSWGGLRARDDSAWRDLCVRETWIPHNNTIMRFVVTGPEDAKVFRRFPDLADATGIDIAYNSYPPKGKYGCGLKGAVSQMFLAEGVDPSHPMRQSYGFHLQCGDSNRAEKNWIPFQKRGEMLFVYSIQPHVIVKAEAGGKCNKQFYSSYAPLVRLQADQPSFAMRGSAQALLVRDIAATPRMPKIHYLALMHIVDLKTKRYAHFAYRFNHEEPFEILQVSSQLTLQAAHPLEGGSAFAFASGLAIREREVVITYAAGDREPRALVLTLERLDAMFPPN